MRVKSKAQFFELWEAGVLGNRTRLWREPWLAYSWGMEQSASRFGASLRLPEIGFREIRKPGSAGRGAWEKVPWCDVLTTAQRWKEAGRDFVMDDGAPDDKRTLQGEICRTFRGIEGYLTTAKMPMREADNLGLMHHHAYLATRAMLDRYMDASSRDDLDALLERYPDAAVEFTCFSINVGVFPNRNTLFWETRDY